MVIRKVLIIGPSFFGYNRSIAEAFTSLGWETVVESYDMPIHPFKGWLKWQHKFSFNQEKLRKKHWQQYNRYLIQKFKEVNPSLVFILNGNTLSDETLDSFRLSSRVALWMFDALRRYPEAQTLVDHVDAFFCYDKADVDSLKKRGKIAFFMPQACDEKKYFTIPKSKDIDILFVGALYRYYKRIHLLKLVANKFARRKILIFGVYKPFYKNIFKWLLREKRNIYKNCNLQTAQVNEYYNRAKVVLNIHHETQQNGANPKVFEICGAGAYQICDANPYIESLFRNGEVGLYHNEDELLACINDALTQDKTNAAKKAQRIILEGHTFTHRVKEMLDIIKIT